MKTSTILLSATALLAISACSDDKFNEKPDEVNGKITYKTAVWNNAAVSRNPDGSRNIVSMTSEKIDGSDYWLITTVENGIDSKANTDAVAAAASRGTQVTGTDNFYNSFKVYAYAYMPSGDSNTYADNYTAASTFINGETATKASESTYWATENTHYWTTPKYKITFFGLAPATHSNYTLSTQEGQRAMLDFEVPEAVASQPDLMIAEETCNGNGTLDDAVTLTFNHKLAAIKVKVNTQKDPDGTFAKSITSVALKNVKYKGRYLFGSTGFTVGDNRADFTHTLSATPTVDGDGYGIADGEYTFMMMPQDFASGSGVTLVVTTSDGRTLQQSLEGTTAWEAGKTYTYYISDDSRLVEYTLEVPEDEILFSWMAESRKCPVRSYKTTYDSSNGTKVKLSEEAVKWATSIKITSEPPTEMPSYKNDAVWISNAPTGNGAKSTAYDAAADTTYFSSIEASPFETKTPDDDLIRSHAEKYTNVYSGYYDLSTPTGGGELGEEASSITTSNCYVINAPGYYKIPLVYGNARKEGADNQTAYKGWSGDYSLGTMVNSLGESIGTDKDTYLWWDWTTGKRGYQQPTQTWVIWQDHKNLLRDSNLQMSDKDGDGYYRYIHFYISPDDIAAGNVVIGVFSSYGWCVWSWHLWVTPYMPGYTNTSEGVNGDITLTNNAGGTSVMTEKPLGYVAGTWQHWAERKAEATFYQVDDNGNKIGKEATVNLRQEEHWFKPETATYYQWGRKDPFPGLMCSEAGGLDAYNCYQYEYTKKKIYDGDGNETSITYQSPTVAFSDGGYGTVASAIRHPSNFFAGQYWYGNYNEKGSSSRSVSYWNLWGAAANNDLASSRKTVYDPCPKGYKVPPLNALPRLTYTGGNLSALNDNFDPNVRDEDDLFQNMWNTPYKQHTEYINNFGFQIYTSAMNTYGVKPTGSSTINLLALGHRQASSGDAWHLGAYFYYWSSSANVAGNTSAEYKYINGGYLKGNCGLYPNAETNWSSLGLPVWPVKE